MSRPRQVLLDSFFSRADQSGRTYRTAYPADLAVPLGSVSAALLDRHGLDFGAGCPPHWTSCTTDSITSIAAANSFDKSETV
jgi:hypothetical protein